jgi:hypothetical protein
MHIVTTWFNIQQLPFAHLLYLWVSNYSDNNLKATTPLNGINHFDLYVGEALCLLWGTDCIYKYG